MASEQPDLEQMLGLYQLMQTIKHKEGRSDEEMMQMIQNGDFAKMMQVSKKRSTVEGSIECARMLAADRFPFFTEALLRCGFTSSSTGFAVDLGTGCAVYPLALSMMYQGLKFYATDQDTGSHLGFKMSKAALESFAKGESAKPSDKEPETEGGEKSFKHLEDTLLGFQDSDHKRNVAATMRDRVRAVDIAQTNWDALDHLKGQCRLVSAICIQIMVGHRSPDLWKSLLVGAAQLLAAGGLLLLYDTEKWGEWGQVKVLASFIEKHNLGLELVEKTEPIDYSDDPDGRMFILIFRKTSAVFAHRGREAMLRRAEEMKLAGNKAFAQKDFWTAAEHYRGALDTATVALFPVSEQKDAPEGEISKILEKQIEELKACPESEDVAKLCSNLAAALIRSARPAQARSLCESLVQPLAPRWAKGWKRSAEALEACHEEELARASRARAAELERSEKDT